MVLLILSLLIALVSEFVYVVYNETVSLHSWKDIQRLSLEAESGIRVGETFLHRIVRSHSYTYPGRVDLPIPDVGGDGLDAMVVSVIDESGKLNINKVVNPNGTVNQAAYDSFKRLLEYLEIDEALADRVVDWIDSDGEERIGGSENRSKNGFLYSLDELLNIEGITEDDYKKMLPHVTIFGEDRYGKALVNINSADKYVLMSLSDDVTEELAERVIAYRDLKPFQKWQDLRKVAGFGTLYTVLSGKISVKGEAFMVIVNAYKDELRRTTTAVISFRTGNPEYQYWREI